MDKRLLIRSVRRLLALLPAVCAGLLLAGCSFAAQPGTVAAALQSTQKIESLCEARRESTAALAEELSIGGTVLLQDTESGSYYYALPQSGGTASLPLACSGEQGVQLAVEQSFSGMDLPVGTVKLIAYTKTEYQLLTLVCTTLPLMNLQVEGDADAIDKYEASEMTLTLYDNRANAGQPVVTGSGTVHVRGVGSARFPKKGYRLELTQPDGQENDMALLGLRDDGDWILYAGYTETEMVRQVYSARLWQRSCGTHNQLEVDNANDYKYLELFLNGRYWGLYALGYPIDAKQLQIREGEHTFSKYDFLVSESGIDFDSPAEIPGYEVIAGDTVNTDWAALWEPLKAYYRTLLSDAPDTGALRALCDNDNAIDCWLFTNLIQGVDQVLDTGTLYNYRLTARQTENGVRILFTPWDFDLSWGAYSAESTELLNPADNVLMNLNPIHRLLELGDSETLQAVLRRYSELRAGEWSDERLQALADSCEADIFASGAYERDCWRWPESPHSEGQSDLADFRSYVRQRAAAMDSFMEQLAQGTAVMTSGYYANSTGSRAYGSY